MTLRSGHWKGYVECHTHGKGDRAIDMTVQGPQIRGIDANGHLVNGTWDAEQNTVVLTIDQKYAKEEWWGALLDDHTLAGTFKDLFTIRTTPCTGSFRLWLHEATTHTQQEFTVESAPAPVLTPVEAPVTR